MGIRSLAETPAEAEVPNRSPCDRELLVQAASRLRSALELLDQAGAPAHIGATLDMLIVQLQNVVERDCASGRFDQIDRSADLG